MIFFDFCFYNKIMQKNLFLQINNEYLHSLLLPLSEDVRHTKISPEMVRKPILVINSFETSANFLVLMNSFPILVLYFPVLYQDSSSSIVSYS